MFIKTALSGWDNLLNSRIGKAFQFLSSTDLDALKPGDTIEIDGKNVYAMVQEYETKPEDSVRLEAHDIYADLHYIVSGEELMGYVPRTGLVENTAYNAEKDILFYESPSEYERCVLNAGEAAVVTTDLAHSPKCCVSKPGMVKKIVIKIKER